jgi:threonine dehydratase
MFPIAQQHVSAVVLVEDHAIRAAQHALWRALRIIAEPAAAVGIAALISGAYRPEPDERVAVVITGANTTPSSLNTDQI